MKVHYFLILFIRPEHVDVINSFKIRLVDGIKAELLKIKCVLVNTLIG